MRVGTSALRLLEEIGGNWRKLEEIGGVLFLVLFLIKIFKFFKIKMENKKSQLSPIDKFHLTRLVESIAYLNSSETAKRWLAENNRKLLIYFSKFEDENLLEVLNKHLNF